jgi:hypothetical protein
VQDISARSPVVAHDTPARQSLDSARFPRLPRSAIDRKVSPELPTAEEGFEDVGLDDAKQQPPHRKRLFFSKFSESHDKDAGNNSPTVSRFLISGRKRGQSGSGQGSELGTIDRPRTATSIEAQAQEVA